MNAKHIWVPTTETKATVDEHGNIQVWDEIIMTLQTIKPPPTGFTDHKEPAPEPPAPPPP